MDSSAEGVVSQLGSATCVEAAVLDQRGWVAFFDWGWAPVVVDVRAVPGLKSTVRVTFSTPGELSEPSNSVLLEHWDTPMVMFDGRCPANARWERILELRLPLR